YLRIGPRGVLRNANSPATYLNLDRYARLTSLPDGVSAHATPRWERVSSRPRYVWHDHRTHWMTRNALPPMVAADPGVPHTVFRWSLPLRSGDTAVTVRGVLSWNPPP